MGKVHSLYQEGGGIFLTREEGCINKPCYFLTIYYPYSLLKVLCLISSLQMYCFFVSEVSSSSHIFEVTEACSEGSTCKKLIEFVCFSPVYLFLSV